VNARKSVPKILGDNMTPLQAKKRFLALMKPYWLKDLKESRGPKLSHKQYLAKYGEERKERIFYDAYLEDWEWWDYHVKTVQSGKYADADIYGDTVLREALPHSYWAFINYLPIKWEGSEKYDDDPYDLENLYDDETHACIVDGEPSWEDYSTADKRKLNALEKRWDSDKISSEEYSDTWDKITSKYSTQKFHRNEASRVNCRHCGPVIKAMNNMNNWDILSVAEGPDFYAYWEYPAALKKQVKALIPALKGIKPQPKAQAKKTTTKPTAKAKPKATKAKSGRKAPTISATRRKIGTRMRGNDGNMWEVKPAGKSQRWVRGAETFEAPRRKRLDFNWITENSSEKEWAKAGRNTIGAAIKKAKSEGWKPVLSPWSSTDMKPATRKSRMRREAKVWNLMSKSPQWKPWLKFLTDRDADEDMYETMAIFRGNAYWKEKSRNSNRYGPWIYDEDRIYVPDHFSEDGGWQVLVKGNQALLLYYIADYDGGYSTPLMRKTFNLSPVKAAEDWGGDPDGQLAQALNQARSQTRSATPIEITSLPKICAECGADSPQAFGLFDTQNLMIAEAWFCDSACADQNLQTTQITYGAEENYHDFISDMESVMKKYGEMTHFESEFNPSNRILRVAFDLQVATADFDDVVFDAEAADSDMIITDQSDLPDPITWIIWLADPAAVRGRERNPDYAELFWVRGPGQRVRMEDYRRTAEVNGVYGAPFGATQNYDDEGWLSSEATIRNFTDKSVARSLSVGDIVENSETGDLFIVAPVGYYQLQPASETFSAPLARHPLNRFQPRPTHKKTASYWRKRGKDAIFRPKRNEWNLK